MGNFHFGETDADKAARISTYYSGASWIEGRAEDQLREVGRWSGMKEIAAFPDLHPGRYGPVGAAFLADRIYPQLVGPDIGCGMALYRLDLPRRKFKADKFARRLRALEEVPDQHMAEAAMARAGLLGALPSAGISSLGGGNHFLEILAVKEFFDEAAASKIGLGLGDLYILVHTGSRGHGAGIFNDIKTTLCEGFCAGSEDATAYLDLHDRATSWARLNRQMIAEAAANALRTDIRLICDAPHNHVEAYGGDWLHRKGAARPDNGLAPLAGSRDSLSYLLAAEDIPRDALGSLSHGAGRRYDRSSMHGRIKKDRSNLTAMERNRYGGTVICEDKQLLIEEAGHAYKDANVVTAELEAFGVAKKILSMMPLITYKTSRTGAVT